MMVCDMQDAGTGIVLVTADEIILGTDSHVGSGHRNILITGDIDTRRIIHLIIGSGRNRITGNITFAMIEHGIHIARKDRLVMFVDRHRRIRPPKECLRQGSRIINLALYLQHGTSRTQGKARHPLLVEHPFPLAHPDHHTAVGAFLDRIVHREEGAGAVMLRPVELDAAGDPGACQADQSRFDHMVVVDEMAFLDLIVCHLHTSAQFRQDHHLYIFILQIDCVIRLVFAGIFNLFNHGIRIYHPAASLVNTFFQEHRVLFRFTDAIGGEKDIFFPNFYILCHILKLFR